MNYAKIADVVSKEKIVNPQEVYPKSTFKYIDIASIDVTIGKISLNLVKEIDAKNAPSRARKLIEKNDIIVSTVRPNLNATALIPPELDKQICSTGFAVLHCKEMILPKYLYYFTRKKSFVRELIKRTKGANYPAVSIKDILNVNIPLLTITEQKKIVSILERAEQLKEKRKQTNELTAQLAQSVFLEMFGDPTGRTNNKIVTLKEVCEKITDGTHITPNYVSFGIPFLRVTDLTNSNESKKFISKEEHLQFIKHCKPEKGDILYSKNGTIGIAKTVDWDYEFSIFVSLCLLKPKKDIVLSKYLETFLNTPSALQQAISHSKKGTITNLHLNEINKIKIPLPSIDEQKEFINRIKKIEKLQGSQKEANREINWLFGSLIQKAFNGELVN